MRTVSVIALAILVLFVFGGQMNTSAGRADWKPAAVTAGETSAQASGGTVDRMQRKSANSSEMHSTPWLNRFEPLLLLLLGSVLLSVSTGIRLLTRK